ncbi:membrane bound O-acyl transferase [Rhizoclosmatium globosum]|uniref:Membrane bound O-acyl transferase n=1 Tax=Rhizoclosmatium globosum TaxID=329046 RepID=A0A1Y2C947_9FUNG|nr:membrane bound O-acyl transferase [Rhizoclosmatium globosum]|eukprot:ORY43437.1 membrane bound O-acyl transferase [Rhizoclosmatium globosum]
MDLHWREQESEASERLAVANHTESCKECDGGGFQCYKSRVQIHRPMKDYNFIAYLCYLLYAPLYLAGPIMTFNDFMSQTKTRLPSTTNHSQLIRYTLRLILCVVLMETFQHWLFVIAIAKSGTWLSSFTGFEVFCLVVFNLKHIWLKLLIMWRFFRLWALLDGYESVENMGRCMMNNQSASGFWRNWHRSFNRWIVRYVYVPLGGSRLYVLNLLVTFTFVALWHDLEMKLITWGWFICLSIIPEYLAGIYFPHKKWESWRFYQSLCACGAVVNIWLMVCANIVGFGALSGDDGGFLKGIPKMFSSDIMSIMGMFVFWFSVAQVGFSYRRWEEMTEKSTE